MAVLSLALGIGANTAIFTLLDQVLLRRLPVNAPQQLVLLSSAGKHYGNNRGGHVLSYPMYTDFRDRNAAFSGMFCRSGLPLSVSSGGRTESVTGELVSGNYFEVLGVGAALGRVFTPDDDRVPNGHPLAVLSYDFWKIRFELDPSILNQTITVNGYPLTVIGVSRPGFDGVILGESAQIRIPVTMKAQMTPDWDELMDRRSRWVHVFGRLKEGVNAEQAQASLAPFYHQILEQEVRAPAFRNASPDVREQFLRSRIEVLPAARGIAAAGLVENSVDLRQEMRTPLLLLMGMVGLVLLIACANLAGLLLVRAAARQKEIALRLALGADRWRIMRPLLLESLLLSFAGGLAGLLVAIWTGRLLLGLLPAEYTPYRQLNVSALPSLRVLAFTLGVSLITAILFGLAPALLTANPNLASVLKNEAAAVVGGHVRFRKALVAAQVAISLLLLIGAGLFVRSLRNLKDLGPGFPTDRLITFTIDPGLNRYSVERAKAFYARLADNLRGVPGVKAAALAMVPILEGGAWNYPITVDVAEPRPPGSGQENPYLNAVSPGYFATMGIPLVEGRDFDMRDTAVVHHGERDQPAVAIVNEKFARHYFGGRSALGRHIGIGGDAGTPADMRIVGVTKDAKYASIREEVHRQVFLPYMARADVSEMSVYARTSLDPRHVFAAVRNAVREADADLPLFALRTLDADIEDSLVTERMAAALATVFSFVATLLAGIGLYGVLAYTVERRTREIGVRMALGATRENVMGLLMREVLLPVTIGVGIALPVAWMMSKYVGSQLYGLGPHDPGTVAGAIAGIALVACAAGYVPAMRATRIDPMRALRYE